MVYLLSSVKRGGDGAGGTGALLIGLFSVPVLIIAAALLIWGSYRGPAAASAVGSALVLFPISVAILLTIKVNLPNYLRFPRSSEGRFADPKLQELARAIDVGDLASVRSLAEDPALNRSQRNSIGHTILGHAIARAGDPSSGTSAQVEAVQALLKAAGGKWDDAALAPDGQSLARIVSTSGDRATALVDLALRHGANVNGPALSGVYPFIFDPVVDLPRAKVLARHGADLQALAPKSAGGVEGWTLLMCAVDRGRFDLATWLLEQGVDFRHVAPNQVSLETLLSQSSLFHSEAPAPTDPDERRFIEALRVKFGKSR